MKTVNSKRNISNAKRQANAERMIAKAYENEIAGIISTQERVEIEKKYSKYICVRLKSTTRLMLTC